ncbi:MAG: dockerin type I repeat-containing protein, partial [Oscillospiraceae bacterium]|nr:dockerin type I repeat-containing protein [Oscillospiraceae bacterium]
NISTAEELAGLAKLVRNGNEMKNTMINLTSDIVLNDTNNFENWDEQEPANNWIAIGAVDKDAAYAGGGISTQPSSKYTEFSGVFNGNGHTISGMYSMHHNYAGLFARLSGVVTGVIMKDSYAKCVNTQNVDDGCTALWETCAGGIAAVCDRGIINCCEFDGKVYASGQAMAGYGMHGCYAGGITGKFSDDNSGVAALVMAFAFVPAGFLINPAIFMTADGSQILSDSGIYNCINRGSVYAENGTDQNGAGGIVGTGGLFTFQNPDFAVFYCLNLGEISASGDVKIGAMVGNGYKFSEQKSYYTNCDRSSDNDEAINFTAAGMSKQEVVEQMSSSFKYEDGEIYLNFENDMPGDAVDESAWSIETETFSETVQTRNVTMPAPELTCELISHYFGSVIDDENITVKYPKTEGVCKWIMEVASDPEFTDIQMRTAGNPSTEAYALRPGVPYYIRAYGVNTYGTPDENTEYTGTSYLNVMLEDYGVLVATVPESVPDSPESDTIAWGDADENGSVEILDVVLMNRVYVGVDQISESGKKNADTDQDGKITLSDSMNILKMLVHLLEQSDLPIND